VKFLYILDPLDKLELAGDTTYAFMLETAARGHECFTAYLADLAMEHSQAMARARPTKVKEAKIPADAFSVGDGRWTPLGDFDVVFMRKDPPMDQAYLQATWILDAARDQTLVVNDPRGLRELNEHLSILRFPSLIPPTLVTQSPSRLKQFLDEQGGTIIVKPIEGYGGRGVFLVKKGDPNMSSIFETATAHATVWTMAQKYLPEAKLGDKRIMLLEGEFLGAVLRVPQADEARGNLHVGGTAKKTELTAREKEIIRAVKPLLDQFGILFAGIDVIGDHLTEINITSPTGIRHLDGLQGGRAASRVIERIEAIAK
jgi:glutathione synthase